MKKLVKIVLFSMIMLLGTVCMAEEKKESILDNPTTTLTLKNDSETNKVFAVRWKNHPHGCYVIYGRRICDFNKAGGRIVSNEELTTNLIVEGLYCVDWNEENANTRTEETKKEYCFEVMDQNPIIITPDGIQDEVDIIKHPVSIKNCTMDTWVGLVKWIDDKEGNHINYQPMPEAEFKKIGTKVVMLPEGSYAGTQFRPPITLEKDGVRVLIAPAITEFQDELIVDGPVTFEFGDCEGLMKNSS